MLARPGEHKPYAYFYLVFKLGIIVFSLNYTYIKKKVIGLDMIVNNNHLRGRHYRFKIYYVCIDTFIIFIYIYIYIYLFILESIKDTFGM